MKLAVAAGIIAQTLPVLSENEAVGHSQLGQDLASTVTRHAKKDLGLMANGGSRSTTRLHAAPFLQGTSSNGKTRLLMNRAAGNKDDAKKKTCNPFSNEPDVGILSCGMGMYCKEDETLFLGGECAPEVPDGNSLLFAKESHNRASNARLLDRNKFKNMMRKPTMVQPEESLVVECNPSPVVDADVGILLMPPRCEGGQECRPSDASSMGGVCVPETYSSRMLANEEYDCFYYLPGQCDPDFYGCADGNCELDCTGFDNNTGTGVITTSIAEYCVGIYRFPGCGDRCLTLSATVTYANLTVSNSIICNEFSSPYVHKRCYEVDYEALTCSYLINGVACDSCEIVPLANYDGNATYSCTQPILKFDCGNIDGSAGINYPLDGFEYAPIIESCYEPGPHPSCTLCPEEGTIFNETGVYDIPFDIPGVPASRGSFFCGGMSYVVYTYPNGVMEDYCTAISAVTAEYCCIPDNAEDPNDPAEPAPAPMTPQSPDAQPPADSSAIPMAAGMLAATAAALVVAVAL